MPKNENKPNEPKVEGEKDPDQWFNELNSLLNKKTQEVLENVDEEVSKKAEINRILITDFWRLWNKFNDFNIHFVMEPSHEQFASFEEFPTKWKFKPNFDFSSISHLSLLDRTQEEGRVGDGIKVWYYTKEGNGTYLVMIFEFCEGEHYYKYSGWKRIYSQYTLYEENISNIDIEKIHLIFTDLIKTWFESHLKHSRDILINYIRDTYPKRESYSI